MATTTTTPLEDLLFAELDKIDATSALIASATLTVVDKPENERFCARYTAKLISPSGMVWRETYPHNDLAVIAQRVARW